MHIAHLFKAPSLTSHALLGNNLAWWLRTQAPELEKDECKYWTLHLLRGHESLFTLFKPQSFHL